MGNEQRGERWSWQRRRLQESLVEIVEVEVDYESLGLGTDPWVIGKEVHWWWWGRGD